MGGRVHFIGVCGTAMATVAAMLKQRGWDVRGSDHGIYPPMSTFLETEGIRAHDGYKAENITSDLELVVVGNAISRGNPELEAVLEKKIRYCSLPEMVREQFLWGARSVVIAGTHGKTTTTSLVGWVLADGGLDPSVLIGGIAANFNASYRLGNGRHFVLEGDEYDSAYFDKTAKFLKYLPDIAVVNNIEFDHADIYPDIDAVHLAFKRLALLVPRNGLLLLGSDSPLAASLAERSFAPVETFGTGDAPAVVATNGSGPTSGASGKVAGPRAHWQAADIKVTPSGTAFKVRKSGSLLGTFEIPLLGLHNVRNSLAAIAVGMSAGLDPRTIAGSLERFQGVKRRLELRGSVDGIRVYDDFAHHPTAIAETLSALRLAHPNERIWAIFEPRSASSCLKVFQKDFVEALRGADEVVLAAVFRDRIAEDKRLSPEQIVADLRAEGTSAHFVPTTQGIVEQVKVEARKGDLIVVMSNGGFENIHDRLLTALKERAH
jgi:UDP-N-acetylmuramate: L-alanyl-gamma-D-glutamyl-meso-diaminopimelate ligase